MDSAALRAASRNGNVIELPLVLAIGCASTFVERCRALGSQAQSKFLVRACDLASAKRLALRPVIIVVPRRLYDEKMVELDKLALSNDAALLTC